MCPLFRRCERTFLKGQFERWGHFEGRGGETKPKGKKFAGYLKHECKLVSIAWHTQLFGLVLLHDTY